MLVRISCLGVSKMHTKLYGYTQCCHCVLNTTDLCSHIDMYIAANVYIAGTPFHSMGHESIDQLQLLKGCSLS